MQGAVHRAARLFSCPACRRIDGPQGVHVQFAFRGEHTGHDAVCTGFHQLCRALLHLGQLPVVVAEIAEAGPQQGPHRQACLGFDLAQQRQAGRRAAHDQVGAQLQPVGPAPLCRKGACDTVYTNF